MLIDLKIDGKYIMVVGGGAEAYRKTLSFLNSGAKILVASKTSSSGIKKLHRLKKISLQETEVQDAEAFVKSLNPKPDLLLAVTNNHRLNVQLVNQAKLVGCMVYTVDNPSLSDFILPALAKVGEIRIAISTSGKSPAIARVLRRRIEKMITQEDLLQIKLQSYARSILKKQIMDQKIRRKILYEILKDGKIKRLLREGQFDEAIGMAMKILKRSRIKYKKEATAAVEQSFQEA